MFGRATRGLDKNNGKSSAYVATFGASSGSIRMPVMSGLFLNVHKKDLRVKINIRGERTPLLGPICDPEGERKVTIHLHMGRRSRINSLNPVHH